MFQSLKGFRGNLNFRFRMQAGERVVGFNPWKGFEAIWTLPPPTNDRKNVFQSLKGFRGNLNLKRQKILFYAPRSFNPWKGFEAIWTRAKGDRRSPLSSFNPWKGFEAIWTLNNWLTCVSNCGFQSLKGFRGNLNETPSNEPN